MANEYRIKDSDLHALKNEIKLAEKLNEDGLETQMREAVERYTGIHVPAIGGNWDIVLNEIYPIVQYNLPSIFFRNPQVFLKPRNKTFIVKKRNPVTNVMEEVYADSAKSAKTQEAILNYLISEIRYKQEVRKVLMDALLFKHGVLWHGYKGDFGMTDEQSIYIKDDNVFVKRLNPLRFLKDPAVTMANLDEARWVGRSFDVPLEDLLEDDRLDTDKKAIKGKVGYGDKIQVGESEALFGSTTVPVMRPLIKFADDDYANSQRAKFVKVYEIFRRPSPKEKREGDKGSIILLTFEQKAALRSNKWIYKAEGWPGHVLQFNELNDGQFGLADLDTYKTVADQKNAIVNLQLRNAQENSKVWVGLSKEGTNEEDVEQVKRGDQQIVLFESGKPSERMFVASPGGHASSELYLIDGRIDKNLQDKSGVTDLKKGFLQSGEESATSVELRAAGGSARPAYRQDLMADFLKDSMHYINQLAKQFFPIDKAVRIVGSMDVEWSDNPTKEEVQADVDVTIDVNSMLPENPEKEIKELQTVLQLGVEAVNNPALQQKITQEGYTFNFSPLIVHLLDRLKIRDPEVFRRIKPEESQGFVSVQQMREAKENVNAALAGTQVPFPPKEGDDHLGKLEVYTSIKGVLDAAGQISDMLEELIQIQSALLSQQQEKAGPQSGQSVSSLKKPTFEQAGA